MGLDEPKKKEPKGPVGDMWVQSLRPGQASVDETKPLAEVPELRPAMIDKEKELLLPPDKGLGGLEQ